MDQKKKKVAKLNIPCFEKPQIKREDYDSVKIY